MADAIILFEGKVKRTTNLTKITYNNKRGFVFSFELNGVVYVHTIQADLWKGDQNSRYASSGYYKKTELLKYLSKEGNISIQDLSTHKLKDNDLQDALPGDRIIVQYLRVVTPYNEFCKVDRYTWDFKVGENILDNSLLNILVPDRAERIDPPVDIPTGIEAKAFYFRNIKLINSNDFKENRQNGAYFITLIALIIERINVDIFSILKNDEDLKDYISSQNVEWTAADIFFKPTLEQIRTYYEQILNFYNAFYINQLLFQRQTSITKLRLLAYVLSEKGLAVVPIHDKIKILIQISLGSIVENSRIIELLSMTPVGSLVLKKTPNNEAVVLKIVASVIEAIDQADDFLDGLLQRGNYLNKGQTLFEMLYDKIDDNRISRYTSGLLNDSDNLKRFIDLIHDLWKQSKYNPYFKSPSYTQPINGNGVFPESFFMTNEGKKYYDAEKSPAVLAYSAVGQLAYTYVVGFNFKIKGVTIEVTKVINESEFYEQGGIVSSGNVTDYGLYHLFQPVSVVGYKADLSIVMPESNCVPLFFLYYISDFKDIKSLDFGVILFIDIALNFTGLGELADLRYIKHLSKLGRLPELSATESVLFLKAVNGINSAIDFSAGSALAIAAYLRNTSTDPDIIRFTESLNVFLGILTLCTQISSALIKRKLVAAAHNVIVEKDYLFALGKKSNLSEEALNEIQAIASIDELVSLMKTKLENLPVQGTNTIINRYNSFTLHQDQFDFFAHFYLLHDTDDAWELLNKQYPIENSSLTRTLVDIWQKDIKVLRSERQYIQFLSEYNYMIYTEKDVWEHIHLIKNSLGPRKTGFNPIGGHTTGNFKEINSIADLNNSAGKLLKFDPNLPGLPTEMAKHPSKTLRNGHVLHKNLFIENPNLIANGSNTYEFRNKVYKKVAKKTEINPKWSIDKIKEEFAHALFKKGPGQLVSPETPRFDQSINYMPTIYRSFFSDGTLVEIKIANYEWQNGKLYKDYVSYIEIIEIQ